VPELTHRNHFRFGYDGRWFVARPSPYASWEVAYGRAPAVPADWRAACIDTARLLRAASDEDLWVLSSGGIDSEVALQAFMFAGIPVRVAITRFARDLNRHDIVYAIRFCETHQVPYRMLDIDIEAFFASGAALDHALRASCVQPQLLHTMWAMDQVDGYPILGSGECYLERRAAGPEDAGATHRDGVWEMLEKERIAGWFLSVRPREHARLPARSGRRRAVRRPPARPDRHDPGQGAGLPASFPARAAAEIPRFRDGDAPRRCAETRADPTSGRA
jgi:hypothetical protein